MTAREIEIAFAAEAAAHARAAGELNTFGEAESLELGDARAVYSGAWSPVHGVFGLGLDGPVEERDLLEIQRFYFKKERAPAFWICPATDASLLELLGRDYHCVKKCAVHGVPLSQTPPLPEASGTSQPDHKAWTLSFTQALDPGAREPGLLALTKLHQKETRFYQGSHAAAASFTFFHRGIALVPFPPAAVDSLGLLALQATDAQKWGASFFATGLPSPLPFLYERSLYERI